MDRPTARIDGLLPPGAVLPGPVEVYAGQVWSVGRRDTAFLAARPERARWHLGVPDAPPDLSVNQLELRVGTTGVAVGSRRGASVLVDGTVRPSPVVISHGSGVISPALSGLPSSGTTLTLRIRLEPDTSLARVATALTWPCMPTRRRAHASGWSGRDVADRMAQLGWSLTDGGNEITVLGKTLLALADKVSNCLLADGRRADVVFPQWPPWVDEGAGETRDQRAERRNRCIADVLWRAGAVDVIDIDG